VAVFYARSSRQLTPCRRANAAGRRHFNPSSVGPASSRSRFPPLCMKGRNGPVQPKEKIMGIRRSVLIACGTAVLGVIVADIRPRGGGVSQPDESSDVQRARGPPGRRARSRDLHVPGDRCTPGHRARPEPATGRAIYYHRVHKTGETARGPASRRMVTFAETLVACVAHRHVVSGRRIHRAPVHLRGRDAAEPCWTVRITTLT